MLEMTPVGPPDSQSRRGLDAPAPIRSVHRPLPRRAVSWSKAVIISAGRHQLTGRAAEAAFFAALALLPAILTLVAVLRVERPIFGGNAAQLVSADLAKLLRIVLTVRGSVAADSADSLLTAGNGGVLGLGTVAAVFLLARCMRSLQRALAVVAGVPTRKPGREWGRAVALAALVLLIGSLLLAGFTLGPLLGHSRQVGSEHHGELLDIIWVWGRWPLAAGITLALAMVLLAQETPRAPRRWRAGWCGAGFTVIGWAASTGLLPLYVSLAARFSPAFGALGGGLILLTWLYLLTTCLLFGAEINAVRRTA